VSFDERMAWYSRSRKGADGQIPTGALTKALEQRRTAERAQLAQERAGTGERPGLQPGGAGSVNWTPLGPSIVAAFGRAVTGRVMSLVVGPGGNRVYAGADNGGIWFSGDGGATWNPLDDYQVSPAGARHIPDADALSVGAVAVKFGAMAANDEIYVGTGSFTSHEGIGVLHSTSGGAPGTWALEATNIGGGEIRALTIDPDDSATVLAATTSGICKRPLAGSPATWNQVTSSSFTNGNGWVTSLIVAGQGVSKTYYAAFHGDTVYSSSDGATWNALLGIAPNGGRILLAAGESDPTAVYAFTSAGTLYRLNGNTFQVVNGTPPANVLWPTSSQSNYARALAVDPGNAQTVYIGAELASGPGDLALFKGTLTGGPGSYNFGFTNVANPSADITYVGAGIHPDAHALAFGMNALGTAHVSSIVWIGCDGGVYVSTMSGANNTFRSQNLGLAIAEPYYLAQRADTDAVVFAGLQDNGTVRFIGEAAFGEPIGGDSGGVAVDPNNPYNVMRQYVGSSLDASTDGGFSFTHLTFPPLAANTPAQTNAAVTEYGNTGSFSPIATTPLGVAPTRAAFGTNRLWVTSDWGTSWTTLPTNTNPYGPPVPDLNQDVIDTTPITAITFASATRIFAATDTNIWRYDFNGANWGRTIIDTSTLPNPHHITSLAVENVATGSFYAALGPTVGIAHLYYFDGASWTAAMPTTVIDALATAVVLDPLNTNAIYVGTDVGCYQGTRTGSTSWTWQLFSQGLPESAVKDLRVLQTPGGGRLLRAATFGRGLWEIPLGTMTVYNPDIYMRANACDNGRVTGGVRNTWIENLPDPTRQNFTVFHWMSPDIKVRRGSLGGPTLNAPANYLDFAVNIGDYADSTSNIETADVTGPNRFFVEVHNRDSITPVAGAQVRVLLLLADAFAGPPPLPANYASHINAGDTTNWLAGSQWHFADPVAPYRNLPGTLDVRNPQVVEYDVDLTSAIPMLPQGHDHVCAAAFVTTPSEQVTASDPSIDIATMQDKHVAQRNLHLVVTGAMPLAESIGFRQYPEAFLLDFHNPHEHETFIDMVFDRRAFPGHLTVVLPRLPELEHPGARDGFTLVSHAGGRGSSVQSLLGEAFEHIGELLEDLGEALERHGSLRDDAAGTKLTARDQRMLRKLAPLDRTRLYVAEAEHIPRLKGVRLPPRGFITCAVIVQAPEHAVPGDQFAFHVIQEADGKRTGGSSYVVAVTQQQEVPSRGSRDPSRTGSTPSVTTAGKGVLGILIAIVLLAALLVAIAIINGWL
jgi:hypothetical protein